MIACATLVFCLLVSQTEGVDPTAAIVKTGDVLHAYVGSTVEIQCDVGNRPSTFTTEWAVDNVTCSKTTCRIVVAKDRLPSDQQKYGLKFVLSDSYILIIKNVDETDDRLYYCQLPIGDHVRASDSLRLKVIEKPTIDSLNTSSDMTVQVGDDVDLFCAAFGRPTPTIRWTRAGNGMMPGGGFVRMGSKFTIRKIKPEHRGPYICTAGNDYGVVHRTIYINMKFPPEVFARPSEATQKVGYETRLFCHINANPAATEVGWTVDGDEISDDHPDYKITSYESAFRKVVSKLTIYRVTEQTYSSEIVCWARNGVGDTGSDKFKVIKADTVQPIPGASSRTSLISYTASLLTLALLLALL